MKKLFSLVFFIVLFDWMVQAQQVKVHVAGNMHDVMWNGNLGSNIKFDTLPHQATLYGMGPGSALRGEVMMFDGECYTSYVLDEDYMEIEKGFYGSSPFFAYAHVNRWEQVKLPSSVKDIKQLEKFLNARSKKYRQPFLFKIEGVINEAQIHVLNLTRGSIIKKPEDAHRGMMKYRLFDKPAYVLGFFSQYHKSIFTHHDSFVHMHLLTKDKTKMGHVDELKFNPKQVALFIAVE